MQRHLKRSFGKGHEPRFFFVIEDLTTAGEATRPHAHGCIELTRAPVPKAGKGSTKLARQAREGQLAEAEHEAGKLLIRETLKAAAGGDGPRIADASGIDQSRNFWWRKPYGALFNTEWVDYAFRNEKKVSQKLGDGRLAMSRSLNQEAKRFWNLIREGEPAIDQWR